MKPLYPVCRLLLLSLILLLGLTPGFAQCPDGHPTGGTVYDTTISTPAGITTRQIKFPKFDPQNGMVTCVRLCVAITGIVDTMSVENTSASSQTADVYYIRTDEITGPGLSTSLTNSLNHHYGTYNLGANDGVAGSGADFVGFSDDTLLNAQTVCRTLSDSATLAQFYGSDSVTYNYNISALVSPSSSGNYNFTVGTSAFVNFRFEYCTCPSTILPLNVEWFTVNKLSDTRAELQWSGYDDVFANYYYEAEVSRDSRNFSSIGSLPKNTSTDDPYKMNFTVPNGEKGVYYFRIKQVYSNGYVRYSIIKQVVLESSATTKFSIFPNPSSGIVGIKFDNSIEGQFDIRIYNTQGQLIVQKEVVIAGNSQVQVATLKPGVYWLRLTDKKSQESSVNQLLIK